MRLDWMRVAALGCCGLIFVACDDGGGSTPPEEPVIPGDEWPVIDASADGAGAGTDGFVFGSGARPSGQARLGRHPASPALFAGSEARCRPGDYVLENDHVRACVSGKVAGDPFFATGGYLVDLVPTANPTGDDVESFATAIGLRSASAEDIRIVDDGSTGGSAVLRVSGVDAPLRLMVGALGSDALAKPQNVDTEIEYRLAPDGRYVEIVTWVKLAGTQGVPLRAGLVALLGDLTHTWVKGLGEARPAKPYPYMVVAGEQHSWGYYSPKNAPMGGLEMLSESLYLEVNAEGRLGNQSDAAFRRYVTVVENGSSMDIEAALAGVLPASSSVGAVQFALTAETSIAWESPMWSIERIVEDGDDVPELFVRFRAGELTRDIALTPGEYRAVPVGWPTSAPTTIEFTVSGAGEALTLPRPALRPLPIEVLDEDGERIAAQIRYRDEEGGTAVFYHVPGHVDAIPVSTNSDFWLEISSGETRDYDAEDYDVATSSVSVTLSTTISDTDDWATADFHQHAQRSADSSAPNVERVFGNMAAGLSIMAPSDHDIVEDFASIARELGVYDRIYVFQGTEISPLRGHINAFPVLYDRTREVFGAASLIERVEARVYRQLNTNEILDRVRAQGVEIVQINHGRDRSQGLLNHVAYDFATHTAKKNPNNFPRQFETMEIFNTASVFCWLFRDWQAMLLHGARVTGLGNSDTHSISTNVGYPRNYVHVGVDQDGLTDAVVIDALRSLRVSVSGGALVRYVDHLPGDRISIAGATTVDVSVDVPTWSNITQLAAFVNGVPVYSQALDLVGSDPAKRSVIVEIPVTVSSDSTFTVLVWSNDEMTYVNPGKRPFGFANPLFLDVGGNGWTAPGESAASLAQLPQGIDICTADPTSESFDASELPEGHSHEPTLSTTHMHQHARQAPRGGHTHSHGDGHVHHH